MTTAPTAGPRVRDADALPAGGRRVTGARQGPAGSTGAICPPSDIPTDRKDIDGNPAPVTKHGPVDALRTTGRPGPLIVPSKRGPAGSHGAGVAVGAL
jgi:hypothetical protein